MKVSFLSGLMLAGFAGLAVGGDEPVLLESDRADLRHAGHLYFNLATGERLLTKIGSTGAEEAASSGIGEGIWVIGGPATGCPDGGATSVFFALDEMSSSGVASSPELLDWADIPMDTVVDAVQVHWITDHADTDTNSDGFADGVEGFGATWTFWDGMNGRSPQLESIAMPIIGFTFYSLPGEYPVDSATVAFYTADIDLGASFGTSLSFEIGDTDSDLQGAAVHNARFDLNDADLDGIPDIDPDQDGLADWAWSIDFTQPGTRDLDNADGDSDSQTGIDGELNDFAMAGVAFGLAQPGEAVFDPERETWSWVPGPGAPATEDAFGLFSEGVYSGPLFLGGFSCEPYSPVADFAIVLYAGPEQSSCSPADLGGNPDGSPDGLLNMFDVSRFLAFFSAGDLRVDFAGNVDGTPDGLLNFSDVTAFLALYAAGCL